MFNNDFISMQEIINILGLVVNKIVYSLLYVNGFMFFYILIIVICLIMYVVIIFIVYVNC